MNDSYITQDRARAIHFPGVGEKVEEFETCETFLMEQSFNFEKNVTGGNKDFHYVSEM